MAALTTNSIFASQSLDLASNRNSHEYQGQHAPESTANHQPTNSQLRLYSTVPATETRRRTCLATVQYRHANRRCCFRQLSTCHVAPQLLPPLGWGSSELELVAVMG